jgi:hypothetical protein
MEPWSLPLPRVVTVAGGLTQFELGANKTHGILLFVLG